MKTTVEMAKNSGFVTTLFNRRIYLPNIDTKGPAGGFAERAAINEPIQGSASDIIKRAMIKVDRWLTMSQVDARMIMQVHDELVLEVKEKEQARVTGVLKQYMSTAADLKIPLVVETGVGKNWDDAH